MNNCECEIKSNEKEEERMGFKNAVNGHHIIPTWLTISPSSMFT